MSEEEIIDKVMMIDQWKVSGDIYTQNELNAIGELLDLYNKEKEKNKKLQDDNIKYKNANDYLSSLNHKYYEDNVLLLRKNGHIDILKDNIHFKYIDDEKNYISKDKIKELFKKLNKITSRTDGKVNAWDYMILGDTTRATGRFINLDYIEKILFDEDGYSIGE